MGISQIARDLKPSATLAMNEKARLLKEKGEKVIHLGAGEPKSKAPFDAIIGASGKLKTGEIRYTPTEGIPNLIKAVIRYTEENYDTIIGTKNVLISNGAKSSIYNLLVSLINPQDEVIVLAPYWVSYPDMIKMVYGVPVIVTPEDGRFQPTIEEIIDKTGSYTKAIIVNSPNNPSGVVYSEDFIAELVEFCEKKGIYLIMDDIYHKLVFDGARAVSVYKYSKVGIEESKIIVVNGVSKVYAMTGFRIGWTVANKQVTEALIKVQGQNATCTSVLLQEAAAAALNGVQSGVEALRLTLENNRNVMMTELNAFTGIKTVKPKGTFYCLPDFRAYSKNSTELANFLLQKALVVTVPGVEFGMEGHLRLSFCGTIKEIMEGVARIKWALDPESPNEIYIGDRKLRRDW
ncbi:MAG: aminotransferase class I/II-fold pyridoxal phosphate-dependent enzyme [Candidatus Zixiibacteriota bacterium]